MHSELQCAWTGALVQAGGVGAVVWSPLVPSSQKLPIMLMTSPPVFLRALWMHLRVCWDMLPGRFVFWFSHIFGWGTTAILLAAALAATGVSNRIGSTCLPNHSYTVADFWAWLIVFAGLALAIQLATSGYCIMVYICNLIADRSIDTGNANAYMGNATVRKSMKPIGAKVTWEKVRNVLLSQWRSLAINILVIIEAVYFTAVFLREDLLAASPMTPSRIMTLDLWTLCLIESGGDKTACLGQAEKFTLGPSIVLASVVLVSVRLIP